MKAEHLDDLILEIEEYLIVDGVKLADSMAFTVFLRETLTNKIKEAELRGRIKQLHDLRSAVLQAENPDDPTSLGVLTYVKLELKDLEAQL